jgi:hypothetical protein
VPGIVWSSCASLVSALDPREDHVRQDTQTVRLGRDQCIAVAAESQGHGGRAVDRAGILRPYIGMPGVGAWPGPGESCDGRAGLKRAGNARDDLHPGFADSVYVPPARVIVTVAGAP